MAAGLCELRRYGASVYDLDLSIGRISERFVMRDHQDGLSTLFAQRIEEPDNVFGILRIQVSRRFIG
jgi:hypothetical protein